jgi:hypothetical protein
MAGLASELESSWATAQTLKGEMAVRKGCSRASSIAGDYAMKDIKSTGYVPG